MDPFSMRYDRLAYVPGPVEKGDGIQDYLIFLIGGNPGLISYYEPFLSTLHTLLLSSSLSQSAQFYVYANSLAGFDNAELANGKETSEPVGLQAQIDNTEDLIYSRIHLYQKGKDPGDPVPKVILMGHSVGGYILLELIRRHKNRIESDDQGDFDLIGGILLYPTIVNIAKSPMGMVASVSAPPKKTCVNKKAY